MSERNDHDDLLFVGTHGHVLAVEKATGTTKWELSLPGTGYGVASIVFEDGKLFVACGGKVFSIDPLDGNVLWTNNLPGMGMGHVFLTTARSNDTEQVMSLLAAEAQRQQSSSSAAS